MKKLIFNPAEQCESDAGYRIINDGDPVPTGYIVIIIASSNKVLRYLNTMESKYYALIDAVNQLTLKLT
jgi:hypothetical protein